MRFQRVHVLGHQIHAWILALGVAEGLVLFSAVYVAGYVRSLGNLSIIDNEEGHLLLDAVAFLTVMMASMIATGLYQPRQRVRHYGTLVRIGVAYAVGGVALTVIYYALPDVRIWRGVAALAMAYSFLMIVAIRLIFLRVSDEDIFKRRSLVYGWGKRAASVLELRRRSDQRGFKIVGFVGPSGEEPAVASAKRLELTETLLDYVQANDVDEIVVAMDDRRRGLPTEQLMQCRLNGIHVVDILEFLEREAGKVNIRLLSPSYLIFSGGFVLSPAREAVKRFVDLAAAGMLFLFTLPLMLLVAGAIWLEDGGSVLYRQQRVGRHGKRFTLYKFRSMTEGAEADTGPQWAAANDERVTRVGTYIRKARIDELPQLVNVLGGQMSFVGPRPERPEFVDYLKEKIPYYRERLCVKPGITGWAQLCYPYGATDHDALEKLQYDLYYVKHKSLIFDLMILLQTAEVVLWGKGAR